MRSQMEARSENTRVWLASRYEHLETGSTSGKGCFGLLIALALLASGSSLIVYAMTGGWQ